MEPVKRGRSRKKTTESAERTKPPAARGRRKKTSGVTPVKKERPIRNVRKIVQLMQYESDTSEDQNDSASRETPVKKSEAIFKSQEDFQGTPMLGFKCYKKRNNLSEVASKVNTSQLLNTPQSKPLRSTTPQLKPLRSTTPQLKTLRSTTPELKPLRSTTPHILRKTFKKEFRKLLDEDDDEDFSGSDDEFIPKSSSSESGEEDEQDSNSENEDDLNSDNADYTTSSTRLSTRKTNIAPSQFRGKDEEYVMKSDDYFSWQANSKIVTSNHTLQKLKNPKLSEDELQRLLMSCSLNQSKDHEKAIHEMVKLNCYNFNKWLYILHEGFNVLLYGLGSKRNILITFQNEMLTNSAVIVVHGYFPSLTIKDVTDSILLDVFNYANAPGNVFEALEVIKEKCSKLKKEHLYLIVHNIDGPMLRNHKSQAVLSSLADIPNIHLLASVDHINTPLIWDHTKLSKFNFTWWDATSFLPYTDETSFENSMLVQRSGALVLSSLSNVYQSLTKNSKGVFMLIVKYQLNNKSVKYYQGMPFKVLYSQCRENFLVSSDLALRTQLTEFLDHKLVKSKRAADGVELLLIPLNHSLLQQFLEQINT